MTDDATLISRSWTTGWADWIHGELWLLPDGLARRRLTLRETRANGNRRTVPDPLPRIATQSLTPKLAAADHRTNKLLAFRDIATARLHRGALTDRLALTMRDGKQHKLLWLSRDPAHDILDNALGEALGQRLTND